MSVCNIKLQQICTKIFRPWDQEISTNQDCTITSTTTSTLKSGNSNFNENLTKLSENSELSDLTSKVKLEFNNYTTLDNGYNALNIPYHPPEYNPPSSIYKCPEFLPFIGVDPFTMGTVEQEYVRVITQEAQSKMLNMRKQRPKKFKCPHCNVAFSNNGQLKGHIRIHTGERPFKCEESNCGKTFTRNEELTRHKRIHTGVRPFPCGTCGKHFGRRDHLKKHTKTHFVQERYLTPAVYLPMCSYLYGY